MTDRLAYARSPSDHGWNFGDVLTIVEDYGSAMSVRNARTGECKTVLTSALEMIPTSAIFRDEMMEHVGEACSRNGYGDSACGEFCATGRDLAALALFEAISEVSEDRTCASWETGIGSVVWAWLVDGEMSLPMGDDLSFYDGIKAKIIALANASQVWWADYLYAVPLAEWVDEHGEAPRVTVVRPKTPRPEPTDCECGPGAYLTDDAGNCAACGLPIDG